MPSKSKSKGNRFENEIVKLFNSVHQTEEFRRTPNSGAMMGRSNAVKYAGLDESVQRTLGSDIITPSWYPFAIECKSYASSPNYSAIFSGHDTKLDHWLGEALFDARTFKQHPMLCFKTTRKGTFVAVPKYMVELGWEPPFYLTYNSIFMISGIDRWLSTAATVCNNMDKAADLHKNRMYKSEEAEYFLNCLEK